MKLYIPEINDLLRLSQPWQFPLHYESRNTTLLQLSGQCNAGWNGYSSNLSPINFELPVDTLLVVDRIYIRKGSSDYSSLTFRIKACSIKEYVGKRFWAKLKDCNTIEFLHEEKGPEVDKVFAIEPEVTFPNEDQLQIGSNFVKVDVTLTETDKQWKVLRTYKAVVDFELIVENKGGFLLKRPNQITQYIGRLMSLDGKGKGLDISTYNHWNVERNIRKSLGKERKKIERYFNLVP